MRLLIFSILLLTSQVVLAQETTKHMITIGDSMGFNVSGQSGTAETDDELGIKDFNIGSGNISLNYHHTVAPRWQIGIYVSSQSSTSEIKYKAGGKLKNEDSSTAVYIGATYNFQDELSNSFYLSLALGRESYESEEKDTSDGTESDTEYDIGATSLVFGKRFDLKGMGIQNLSYSPSIQYVHGKVGGDLEDSGVDSLSQFRIDFVKFDLLF
jgi:hypothetical protein